MSINVISLKIDDNERREGISTVDRNNYSDVKSEEGTSLLSELYIYSSLVAVLVHGHWSRCVNSCV